MHKFPFPYAVTKTENERVKSFVTTFFKIKALESSSSIIRYQAIMTAMATISNYRLVLYFVPQQFTRISPIRMIYNYAVITRSHGVIKR